MMIYVLAAIQLSANEQLVELTHRVGCVLSAWLLSGFKDELEKSEHDSDPI